MWWVPFSLRVGTQSHSFIQNPIQSLYKYWHMLDICKCSCIFGRKKLRKNGRKERRKGRKGERERESRREGGGEGGREGEQIGGRTYECPNNKVFLRLPPVHSLVGVYPKAPFQLGSQVLKHSPHIEGQCPARPLPPLSTERVLAVTEDYSGTLADQLLLC